MRELFNASPAVLCAGLLFASPACYAAELQSGQSLHDEECVICHDSSVYTRENRRVKTHAELAARVDMCQQDVGAEWDPLQFEDVVGYLNDSFYLFPILAPASGNHD